MKYNYCGREVNQSYLENHGIFLGVVGFDSQSSRTVLCHTHRAGFSDLPDASRSLLWKLQLKRQKANKEFISLTRNMTLAED